MIMESIALFQFNVSAILDLVHGKPHADGITAIVKTDLAQRRFHIFGPEGIGHPA
jgi:hypothetical protein